MVSLSVILPPCFISLDGDYALEGGQQDRHYPLTPLWELSRLLLFPSAVGEPQTVHKFDQPRLQLESWLKQLALASRKETYQDEEELDRSDCIGSVGLGGVRNDSSGRYPSR